MQLTDDEDLRVEQACSRVKNFAFLEGDAVPLSSSLFISNGTDLTTRQSCAILFEEDGSVLYHFNVQELRTVKSTRTVPIVVAMQGPFDERGQAWWDWWVEELS